MTEKRKLLFNRLEIIGFFLYFVILFVERLLALIFSVHGGEEYALSAGNNFNTIAYSVTAASLVIGTVLAVKPCLEMGKCLFSSRIFSFETRSLDLAVAVSAILFGGMMHTGFTLAGVQFAAYSFLIASLILRAVEVCMDGGDKYLAVVSVVYLTLFSMTIPVAYISFMEMPLLALFFTAEFLAVFALVPIFGYMMYLFISEGVTNFSPVFPAVMLALSGATVALKWTEEVNTFVLIFVALTVLCYLAFGIIAYRRVKSRPAALDITDLDGSDDDALNAISSMAEEIWHEHYDPIIGSAQVDYMVGRFLSPAAIKEQMSEGYAYRLAVAEGRKVGFFAYCLRQDALYLSKVYLYKSERGKGYAHTMLSYLKEEATASSLSAIELNVNKHNDASIAVYERLGFVRLRDEKNDIGEGFFMDDYVYRLTFGEGAGK